MHGISGIIRLFLPHGLRPSSIVRRVIESRTQGMVVSGPFYGMKWRSFGHENDHLPYLLGTYELELHRIFEELSVKHFDDIVTVGAGHGYYTIGCGRRFPGARIVAFEVETTRRTFLREMAHLNSVHERLVVHGECTIQNFREVMQTKGEKLVIMDVEGFEETLLDPGIIPQLCSCNILVELHEFAVQNIAEVVIRRFQQTHQRVEIWSIARCIEDFPLKSPLWRLQTLARHCVGAMDEHRPGKMRWFFLQPREK